MARTGVQKEEVFQAADELARRGVAITVANVRHELGTGSYSTLLPLINEYQAAKRSAAADAAQAPPAMPPEIASATAQFTQQIWAHAAGLAQTRVREIEAQAKEREAQLTTEVQAKAEELAQAHKDIQSVENELQEVRGHFEASRQAATLIEGEALALRTQLKEKDAELRSLLERAARAEHEVELLRNQGSSSRQK